MLQKRYKSDPMLRQEASPSALRKQANNTIKQDLSIFNGNNYMPTLLGMDVFSCSPVYNYVLKNDTMVLKLEQISSDNHTEDLLSFNVHFQLFIKESSLSFKIIKKISELQNFFSKISKQNDLLLAELCKIYRTILNKTACRFKSLYRFLLSFMFNQTALPHDEDSRESMLLLWKRLFSFLTYNLHVMLNSPKISTSSLFADFFSIFPASNPLLIRRYIFLKVIGKGSVGKVFYALDTLTSSHVAIKSIHKNSIMNFKQLEHFLSEKRILNLLSDVANPFVVKLLCAFETEFDAFYVFPFYRGGDLATMLGTHPIFREDEALLILAQIILGLECLHDNHVIYRDLKPENILFDDNGYLVLADFGLSKIVHDQFTSTICGTFDYLAPEILKGEPYSFSVDIWSLGIIMYELLVGSPPFSGNGLIDEIVCDTISFPPLGISADTKNLCLALLEKDPKKRPTITQVKSNRIFRHIDYESLAARKVALNYGPKKDPLGTCINFDSIFTNLPVAISPPTIDSFQMGCPSYFLSPYSPVF